MTCKYSVLYTLQTDTKQQQIRFPAGEQEAANKHVLAQHNITALGTSHSTANSIPTRLSSAQYHSSRHKPQHSQQHNITALGTTNSNSKSISLVLRHHCRWHKPQHSQQQTNQLKHSTISQLQAQPQHSQQQTNKSQLSTISQLQAPPTATANQ